MGGGCGTAVRGLGGRGRCGALGSIVRSGRRHMCRSSDSEVGGDLVSVLVGADGAALDGCRLGLVTASSRGGADMAVASASWASTDLARSTASVGSRRCMGERGSRTWRTSTMRTSAVRSRPWEPVKFGAGRTTAVAATHAQLSGARMMTGNMPVVPTRAEFVGQRTGCRAFHHSQYRAAAFLWYAKHGHAKRVASGIVPAADSASAAVHAAEPLLAGDGWHARDHCGLCGIPGHDGCGGREGRCYGKYDKLLGMANGMEIVAARRIRRLPRTARSRRPLLVANRTAASGSRSRRPPTAARLRVAVTGR